MGVDPIAFPPSARAVFLDRDGVLNHTVIRNGVSHPPATVGELTVLPGVEDALRRLRASGLRLIVVTNQPDVARQLQSRESAEAINARLMLELPLDDILVCYHDTADRCDCRKPKPGLLLQGAHAHGIDLPRSFMVGDRWSDVVAGQAAGCRTFLVDTPYSGAERCAPDYLVRDLAEAAELIVSFK